MPYSAASKLCGWCYSRRNTATRRRNKSDMQADNNILLFGQWFRNKQGNSSHASTQPAADAALKTPQARPLLRVTQRALLLFFFLSRQHPARCRRCAQDAACASAPSCHTARSAAFFFFAAYSAPKDAAGAFSWLFFFFGTSDTWPRPQCGSGAFCWLPLSWLLKKTWLISEAADISAASLRLSLRAVASLEAYIGGTCS
jgi:hypothetical protein